MKILNELGKRISPPEYWHDDHEQFLEDVLRPAGLSFAEFVEIGYLKGPDRFNLHLVKGFRTPSGKVELKLSQAEKLKLKPLPEYTGLPEEEWAAYPLLLISAKESLLLAFLLSLGAKAAPEKPASRGTDSSRYGPGPGDKYWRRSGYIYSLWSDYAGGCEITDRVMQGVLCADIGWWFPGGQP
jgi:hypothetical protein